MPITRETLAGLLPHFIREDPIFAALTNTAADRSVALQAAITAILAGFDLEAAVGVQLDRLGEIVQYPRQGETDDRYRRLVQMQIRVILSSAGSAAALIEIVEIWTEATAPAYLEPPTGRAELMIGAALSDLGDDAPLLLFLRRGKAGGVRLDVLESPAASPLIGDYEPGDVVIGAGIGDYEPGDEAEGAALGGYTVKV